MDQTLQMEQIKNGAEFQNIAKEQTSKREQNYKKLEQTPKKWSKF